MKRIGGLFPAIHEFENIYQAYRRARQGKRHRGPVGRFEENLERELLTLRDELCLGRWRPGPFTSFTIHDPKIRLIEAAPFRDRVVHQAVMGILEPWFESWFDFDSYACRKGRGVDRALDRARQLSRRDAWVLKTDIRKCFQSIDQEVLIGLVERRFKDRKLLRLLERIVHHGGDNGKGLPIGSLTSQWLANLYLDRMDRYIRQELRPRGYIRYMDDFALFAPGKEKLKVMRRKLASWLDETLRLQLKEKATNIHSTDRGWPFLGFRVKPHKLELRRETWRCFRRRLGARYHEYQRGKVTADELAASATAMLSHLDRADTKSLRRKELPIGEL